MIRRASLPALLLAACGAEPPTPAPAAPITAPDAPVPAFEPRGFTHALAEGGGAVVLRLSSTADECALGADLDRAPAAVELVATLISAGLYCPSGVYPIRAGCALLRPGGTGSQACAEYRRFGPAGLEQRTPVATGTITVQQTWVDRSTADCDVDLRVSFASGDRVARSYRVRVEQGGLGAPYCARP